MTFRVARAAGVIVVLFAVRDSLEARLLTLEDRVQAQRKIEEVYWRHRVWPKENQTPKPPLSLTEAGLRSKVDNYLQASKALEMLWARPITGEQLQAELDRMARSTHDPQVLQEIFDALGDDARLLAETLARQTLAQRLLRSWHASDARAFESWWVAERPRLASRLDEPAMRYILPSITATTCTVDTWSSMPYGAPDPRSLHAAVWTGSEMIVVGGESRDDGGRYDPSTDTWLPVAHSGAVLTSRTRSVIATTTNAVWTGSSVIVWNGSSGSRYDPATDQWTAISSAGAPRSVYGGFTMVWTGSRMIVWGGEYWVTRQFPAPPGEDIYAVNTGGLYDPVTDTWQATSLGANVPVARTRHSAVWTGSKMIVWGGSNNLNGPTAFLSSGGLYDPSTNSWASTSGGAGAPSARDGHAAIWTGKEMIVWGGRIDFGSPGTPVNTGARYDPVSDSWQPTAVDAFTPSPHFGASVVWAGSEMIVWGGQWLTTGGRYDPISDRWQSTSVVDAPVVGDGHSAVWSGSEMIVWGGYHYSQMGGRYDPSIDRWVSTSIGAGVPSARSRHTAVWTGAEMIVWGGDASSNRLDTGGIYVPSTDTWSPTPMESVPAARGQHTAVWTGNEMIVWGGKTSDLATADYPMAGGRLDPVTNAWTATAGWPTAPIGRVAHSAVWTGSEMIVWGGNYRVHDQFYHLNSGGRYDPRTDSWTAMPGGGTGGARSDHTAIWTGTEMIVWGGDDSVFGSTHYFGSGLRYDPVTDAWTATSITNAPSARAGHTAVWTGTKMVVWGGSGESYLSSGGRYDPATDSWTSTAVSPVGRNGHTAVWTGSQMIMWGGYGFDQNWGAMKTGSRYLPISNTWSATSVGAGVAGARYGHTAVWTGREMIVWGGSPWTSTGGRYCACPAGSWTYLDADGDGHGDPARPLPSCDGTPSPGYVLEGDDCDDADTAIHPGGTEVCNGSDDDCDGTTDQGAGALCDDADSCTIDACNAVDGCAHTTLIFPAEVDGGVRLAGRDVTQITWNAPACSTGADVLRGLVSALPVGPGGGDEECLASDANAVSATDPTAPGAGECFWYLVRGTNPNGGGPYGFEGQHGVASMPRVSATCP